MDQKPSTRLFISQAKPRGEELAIALRDFLRVVVHGCDPWVSKGGIEPGSKFPKEIDYSLSKALAGIVCLTSESQSEPWILFEAGALSQKPHELVWMVLLDLEKGVVRRPLGDFQQTLAHDPDEMFEMVTSISRIVGQVTQHPHDLGDLKRLFGQFWEGELKPTIEKLRAAPPPDRPADPGLEDMVKELFLEAREHRLDAARIHKTLLMVSDLYRRLLERPAPGYKDLVLTPNEVSIEDGARSVRIVVPTGTLTISAPPSLANTGSVGMTDPPALVADGPREKVPDEMRRDSEGR